jgi:hypothetical protein
VTRVGWLEVAELKEQLEALQAGSTPLEQHALDLLGERRQGGAGSGGGEEVNWVQAENEGLRDRIRQLQGETQRLQAFFSSFFLFFLKGRRSGCRRLREGEGLRVTLPRLARR